MKINEMGRIAAANAYGKTNKAVKTEKTEQKRDELQISKAAQQMLSVQKNDILNPAARQEKVEALKAHYESGNYHVDARAIAEKMLRS